MCNLKISDAEKAWLEENFPSLAVSCENGSTSIWGVCEFEMVFHMEGLPYYINPFPEKQSNLLDAYEGVRIRDEFAIKIVLQRRENSLLPPVFEIGGRIERVAREKQLKLSDLHCNDDGSACLCIRTEESKKLPDGFNLPDFFHNLVIPFFYAQSYFEKYGVWPWGEYSHGVLGLLEWYSAAGIQSRKDTEAFLKQLSQYPQWKLIKTRLMNKVGVKGHHVCICGKANKFRDCHIAVFLGLWQLRKDVKLYQPSI